MKANELRIGNLVKHIDKDSVFTVKGIDLLGIDCENDIESMYSSYEMLYYVKLTEEWLLKFGFQKTMSWTYVKDLVGNLELVYYLGEKGWSIGFKSYSDFPNLKYVHELQNLYFALTGKELTYGGNK
jgi:hypothetical protein